MGRIRAIFPSLDVRLTLPRGVPAEVTDPAERRLLDLAAGGLRLAGIALELRRSEFETADLAMALHGRGLLKVDEAAAAVAGDHHDTITTIRALLAEGYKRLSEKRYELALEAYERVLTLDRLNQNAKKGLEFADVGYVLVSGSVAMVGTGAELLHDPQVGRLFLGG